MKTLLLSILFSFSFAQASMMGDVAFDSTTQNLRVEVFYQGGEKTHNYSLAFDSCQVVNGIPQVAARLIDSGWDDTGSENIRHVALFDLSFLSCKPALLTLRSGLKSQKTLWIE